MDGEWDLNAVVRSCATTSPAAAAAGKPTTVEDYDDGSYNLESLASGNERNAFVYPSFGGNPSNVSGGLEDVYKVGHGVPAAPATTSAAIDLAGEGFVRDQLPMLTDSHSFSMHTMSSQSTRTRKRKNQDKRVFQLAQEELSNDVWAWRKYGQKPIKGSPFPRNYYRCSTTKACGAKKQVERSPTDATVFIVSYSGEHIHPRPTHRSYLAGSTRSNKFNTDSSSSKPPVSANTTSTVVEHAPCSSSSPANASSISPTTSSKEDDCEMNEDIDEYDDQDILIPNTVMSDDILKRFRDLSRRGGGSGSGSGGGGSGSGGGGSF